MDVKDIKIRDYIYQLTVPEAARYRDSKEELKRFLDLFAQKFDTIKEKIDNFPSLVDIDSCPPEFLPYLGALVGYEYDPLLPAESQRETIKRITSIYQRKGTPQSIIDIVAPYDPNAHIFEPGYNVARHGVSKFSGSDRFQDKWYWRTGVFELVTSVENLYDLRDLIKSYRPAGKKLWFTNLYQIPLNDAFLFGIHDGGTTIIVQPPSINGLAGAAFSAHTKARQRSGKQILWNESTIYQEAMSDARRYAFGSPLYSFDDIERVQPDFEAEDVLYALNTYESFFEFQMRAVFDPAIVAGGSNILVFDSYVNASGMQFSGSAHVVHQEGQADMRRYIIGSPLYTYAGGIS